MNAASSKPRETDANNGLEKQYETRRAAQPSTPDFTPEGDEIHTVTFWLRFDDGEYPMTMDLTKFTAGLKRAEEAVERWEERRKVASAFAEAESFAASMQRVQEIVNVSPSELRRLQDRLEGLADG